jgi:RNA polymerase sigma factor (TIGR02999 family)
MNDVTRILAAIEQGDPHAAPQLLPLVYDELRRLAASHLSREKPGQTLDATALVHEAYLRLIADQPDGQSKENWANRRHFFAAAAEAMRRILVENVRRKRSIKHGGNLERRELDHLQLAAPQRRLDLLALDEALAKLAAGDPQKAELVKLRYFAGLTQDEAAKVLGISPSGADRLWTYARAWLHREMTAGDLS